MTGTPRGWMVGLDQGTGSSRAILVDARGRIAGVAAVPVRRHVHADGRIDQDAEQCFASLRRAVRELFARTDVSPSAVVGLGLACQRSTTVAYHAERREPLAPAISWQCLRTREWMQRMDARTLQALRRRTGLPPVPHYAASKIAWLHEHLPRRVRRAAGAALRIGTLDSLLAAKLGRDHRPVTDLTQASRTLLVELGDVDWSARSLRCFGLERSWLPEVIPTVGAFGELAARALPPLRAGLPLLALAGDQQAALFGAGCRRRGQAKITYGSGAFLLAATGRRIPAHDPALIRSVAFREADRVHFLLETNVPSAGTVVDWLATLLGEPFDRLLARDARRAPLAERLRAPTFVPAFAGMGPLAPDLPAGGRIDGLTHDTDGPRLASALAAGIAAALAEGADAVQRGLGQRLRELRVDGGGASDRRFLEIQSAVLGRSLRRLRERETTAFGAAALAWYGLTGRAPEVPVAPPAIRPRVSAAVARRVRQRWLATLTGLAEH